MSLACLGAFASVASAGLPYQFEPELSLTGDCTTEPLDPVADPSCPYPAPPEGPTGRFDDPRSVKTDAYGNEYVASYSGEAEEGRIDVFDDEGRFVTELADPNDPKSVAIDSEGNLYAYEGKEIARYAPSVYEPEAGNIEYGNPRTVIGTTELDLFGGLAIDRSNDHLFVAEGDRVREYDSAAEGNGLLATIEDPKIESSGWSTWAAVDAQRRRLYVSYCKDEVFECGTLVLEADAPYEVLEEVDGSETAIGEFRSTKGWLSIAVDEESGHFFVEDLEATKNVYEFDQNYELFSTLKFGGFQGGNFLQIGFANTPLRPEARNSGYLFVPALPSANRALAFQPPAVDPPEVEDLAAGSIAETEALLGGTVDPNGADTEYAIEYVSEAEFQATGFAGAKLAGEGSVSGTALPQQVSARAAGLAPGTAYRFRIAAENEAGDGESEASFATYADAPSAGVCANQALRVGASAHLPDCRAYELVTPPDTGGHPVKGIDFTGDRFNTLQASPAGNAVSFTILGGAIPGLEGTGGLNGDPYLARRGEAGWGTSAVGPSGAEATAAHPGSPAPEQDYRFWDAAEEGSALIEGKETHYVRYPDGHSEPVGRGSLGVDPTAEGRAIVEGGTHIVFETKNISFGPDPADQLEPNAPPTGTEAVYDRTPDEVTHVVSLLPGEVTPAEGENATYLGASPDGRGIAFSIGKRLYLRVGNAATYEIGEEVALAGVSEGGERVFFAKEGDLLAYDTAAEEVVPFTESGDATAVNVAPDGTRAYFVSPSVLSGEANPNGDTAQPGKQNLYLSEEGSLRFVATVTDRDVEGGLSGTGAPYDGLGLWTEVIEDGQPGRDPSRLTPDGRVLVFQSRADLAGYDPEGSPQIYRYDSVSGRLHCISCIPTGLAGGGGASLETQAFGQLKDPPLSPFGFVPNLRADGRRAFFESTEALVSYDTDGLRDVYEWEQEGTGGCARPGGCVYLISSGHSGRDNYLFGQSASGDDVFFVSGDVLAGADAGGTPSIYDARVGGGFPSPSEAECSGEACKPGLTPPPSLQPPQSGAGARSGNVSHRKRCPKGKRKVKRKGKVRCVRKHGKRRKHKKHGRHARRGPGGAKGARR